MGACSPSKVRGSAVVGPRPRGPEEQDWIEELRYRRKLARTGHPVPGRDGEDHAGRRVRELHRRAAAALPRFQLFFFSVGFSADCPSWTLRRSPRRGAGPRRRTVVPAALPRRRRPGSARERWTRSPSARRKQQDPLISAPDRARAGGAPLGRYPRFHELGVVAAVQPRWAGVNAPPDDRADRAAPRAPPGPGGGSTRSARCTRPVRCWRSGSDWPVSEAEPAAGRSTWRSTGPRRMRTRTPRTSTRRRCRCWRARRWTSGRRLTRTRWVRRGRTGSTRRPARWRRASSRTWWYWTATRSAVPAMELSRVQVRATFVDGQPVHAAG